MVDTMRGGIYSRAWYALCFFTGPIGIMIAWLSLHQRDGFHPRGLVIWTLIGQLVFVAAMAAAYVGTIVAVATAPFGHLP